MLKQKREETNSNSAGKLLQMNKPRTETGSAQSAKDNSSAGSKTGMKALSQNDILFDRLSNSSSDIHNMIGEEDLAKDMGIFGFDITGKVQQGSSY